MTPPIPTNGHTPAPLANLDRLAGALFGHATPPPLRHFPLQVDETEEAVHVSVEVPGMKADDLDVSIEGGILEISGEKKALREEARSTERYYGRFVRRVRLGRNLDTEAIEANLSDGVLTITIHRDGEAGPRQIAID